MMSRKDSTNIDISVVVNVHHEGRLFHHTAKGLERSVKYAQGQGLNVEVVIVGDKVNESTRGYLESTLPGVLTEVTYEVVYVDYGDLGLSRNHGVNATRASAVAFLDADNIFSQNWLAKAFEKLQEDTDSVVHPDAFYTFEKYNVIMRNIPSTSPEFDLRRFAEENYWDAACMTSRDVLNRFKYIVTRAGEGFGPEDWHWNTETLIGGVKHVTAPETVFFYRVKTTGSLLAAHLGSNAILPPSKLLTPGGLKAASALRKIEKDTTPPFNTLNEQGDKKRQGLVGRGIRFTIANIGRVTKYVDRIHPRLGGFERELNESLLKLFSPRGIAATPLRNIHTPNWVKSELRALQDIDTYLFPSQSVEYYQIAFSHFTDLYWQYANIIGEKPDYLFLLPWLKRGGADKVALNYIEAILATRPKARIRVILTEREDSPWASRLPLGVEVITLGNEFYRLSEYMQDRLLATLCVQLQPKRIHLINSVIGYRMLSKYAKAISVNTKVSLSLFCVDIMPDGRRAHISLEYLDSFMDFIDRVYTDNVDVVDYYTKLFAFDSKKFSVHYQPIVKDPVGFKNKAVHDPLRILWAARLDRQKRVDILMSVAREAKEAGLVVEFHVWGDTVVGDADGVVLREENGIVYKGGFNDGVASLPLNQYDVFLMTSQWEGLPNAPMEAVAGGLTTLVVPDVGGLKELITDKTGFLIKDYKNPLEYVDSLKKISTDESLVEKRGQNLVKLINDRHLFSDFIETLKKDNYL